MLKRILNFLVDILFFVIGGFIYAFAINIFIVPNQISPGGLTGISTVLNYLFEVPVGLTYLILNIPLVIVGFIKLGGIFIIKTAIATPIVALALDTVEYLNISYNTETILASIFGGLLMGLGLGLIFMRGGASGGTDIIAKLINKRFRHLTVGRMLLLTDGVIILISAVVYKNIESALYSFISIYVSSVVTDTLLYGADKGKIVYVVSRKSEEICSAINERMGRGVTRLNAQGGYTGENYVMLMCTVRRAEVAAVYSIINEFDKTAFIVVAEAGEIVGEGFKAIE